MRERLKALAGASASLVLFLEDIPMPLKVWLAEQTAGGEQASRAAATMLETQRLGLAAFTATREVLHLDVYFDNVLTDGTRLYLADCGLAASCDFELSGEEVVLMERASTHDVVYAITWLVSWAVSSFGDPSCVGDPVARHDYVRGCARGAAVAPLPESAAGMLRRYAPVAAIVNGFYADLFTVRRDTPYPAEELRREFARLASSSRRLGRLLAGLLA